MKKLFVLLLFTTPVYGGLITHNDYTSGNTISASGQNTNENTIVNEINGNLDNTNIKALGVTGANIAPATVTLDKLASVIQSSITAMVVTNVDNTIASTTTFNGPIVLTDNIKANGSYGTTNYILTSVGTGQNAGVQWSNPSTVGTYQLLVSSTVSSQNAVDLTWANGVYQTIIIEVNGLIPASNAVDLRMQVHDSANLITSGYHWGYIRWGNGGTTEGDQTSDTAITLNGNVGVTNGTGSYFSGSYKWNGANSNVENQLHKTMIGSSSFFDSVNSRIEGTVNTGYVLTTGGNITGVKFFMSSGAITSMYIQVYGVKFP